jgi:hypothetical protein
VELLAREELLAPEVIVEVLEEGQVGFQDVVYALGPDELSPELLGCQTLVGLRLDMVRNQKLHGLGFGLGFSGLEIFLKGHS